ncbi:Sideroflexin FSF1 [Rhodotorula toruloides]
MVGARGRSATRAGAVGVEVRLAVSAGNVGGKGSRQFKGYKGSQPRYDTETYLGRVRHFASITAALTVLASPTDLKNTLWLLKEYQEGTGEGRKAWGHEERFGVLKAKQRERESYGCPSLGHQADLCLVDSSIHPDTGEPVPLPFRVSGFVPTNLVIVAGMLAPNPSLKSLIF